MFAKTILETIIFYADSGDLLTAAFMSLTLYNLITELPHEVQTLHFQQQKEL